MKTVKPLDYFFSFAVVLIPIFQYYFSPIPPLNLSTFLAVIFVPIFFLQQLLNKRYTFAKKDSYSLLMPFLYVFFILVDTLITMDIYNYPFSFGNIEGLIRLLVIFLAYVFLGSRHFIFDKAISILEKILLISFGLMLIQVIASFLHHPITFHIGSLVTDRGYAEAGDRFDGLYMEPSHFAHAAIIYLCVKLFKPGFTVYPLRNRKVILVTLGVLLSGSGLGYVFLLMIYAIWYFLFLFKDKSKSLVRKVYYIVFSLGIISVFAYILPKIPYFQNAVGRFTDTDELGGSALIGRTGTNYMFLEMSDVQKMYGVGLGHQQIITYQFFTNALYSHLITYGYFSLVFLSLIFIYIFVKRSMYAKVLTIIFIIELFFADTAAPSMMCQYLLFVFFEDNYVKYTNKNICKL